MLNKILIFLLHAKSHVWFISGWRSDAYRLGYKDKTFQLICHMFMWIKWLGRHFLEMLKNEQFLLTLKINILDTFFSKPCLLKNNKDWHETKVMWRSISKIFRIGRKLIDISSGYRDSLKIGGLLWNFFAHLREITLQNISYSTDQQSNRAPHEFCTLYL